MAVENQSTTATLTEQLTAPVEVTVRVTNNASGTLFEVAEQNIHEITGVTDVTIVETIGITPRHGETHVTVRADVTALDATTATDVTEIVADAVCVEQAETTSVT